MRKLSSFTFLSLNGFYKGENEDTSWHRHGVEEGKYSEESLKAENILLFGRTTYEMMVSFWPTTMATEMYPQVAKGMNQAEKIVFSNTLQSASWHNTRIVKGDIVNQVSQLKSTPGSNMTILGSGTIVTQFTEAKLIDTYQVMIDPVALGKGTVLFANLQQKLNLNLVSSKVFSSGVILLTYVRV